MTLYLPRVAQKWINAYRNRMHSSVQCSTNLRILTQCKLEIPKCSDGCLLFPHGLTLGDKGTFAITATVFLLIQLLTSTKQVSDLRGQGGVGRPLEPGPRSHTLSFWLYSGCHSYQPWLTVGRDCTQARTSGSENLWGPLETGYMESSRGMWL